MANVLDMESGAALQAQVTRELALIEQQARNRKPAQQRREPSAAETIKQLVDAAMPQVARDSKNLERVKAQNEQQRRKDEAARQRALMAIPPQEW